MIWARVHPPRGGVREVPTVAWRGPGLDVRPLLLLIQACLREPLAGIGKPEPLRDNHSCCWLKGALPLIPTGRHHVR